MEQKLTEELVALEEAKARVAQKHARAILADAKQHLTAAGITRVEIEATHGELIDSIERFEAGADMIVVDKRGEHADLAKLHLGGCSAEFGAGHCRHVFSKPWIRPPRNLFAP